MTTTIIRRAVESDLETLVNFNQAMAWETEQKKLDPETLTRGVSAVLKHRAQAFYLLAQRDNTIAGSLMITEEWSDWRAGRFWWIQSVYVAPEFRRQGIYRSLYEEVKTAAEEQGDVCGIRLYVEKENSAAQQTYQQLGMHECQYFMYESK